MDDKLFQNIFDRIQPVIPESWEKLVFYAAYFNGSYTMKFYVDCGNGKYHDCFHIAGVDRIQLIKLFMNLDKELSEERNKLEISSRWNVFTMTVCADGTMKSDFDYTEISDDFTAYEKEWKYHYLSNCKEL